MEPTDPEYVNKDEVNQLAGDKELEKLEVLLIDFAIKNNLVRYLDEHKTLALKEAETILANQKQRPLKPPAPIINISEAIKRLILKDFPQDGSNDLPVHLQSWHYLLRSYVFASIIENGQDVETLRKTVIEGVDQQIRKNPTFFIKSIQTNVDSKSEPKDLPTLFKAEIDTEAIIKFFSDVIIKGNALNNNKARIKSKFKGFLPDEQLDVITSDEFAINQFALLSIETFAKHFKFMMEHKFKEICEESLAIFMVTLGLDRPEIIQERQERLLELFLAQKLEYLKKVIRYTEQETRGRDKTYDALSFRRNLMNTAEKLKAENRNVSLTSLCKALGCRHNILIERAESVGMDKEMLLKFIEQLNDIGNNQ